MATVTKAALATTHVPEKAGSIAVVPVSIAEAMRGATIGKQAATTIMARRKAGCRGVAGNFKEKTKVSIMSTEIIVILSFIGGITIILSIFRNLNNRYYIDIDKISDKFIEIASVRCNKYYSKFILDVVNISRENGLENIESSKLLLSKKTKEIYFGGILAEQLVLFITIFKFKEGKLKEDGLNCAREIIRKLKNFETAYKATDIILTEILENPTSAQLSRSMMVALMFAGNDIENSVAFNKLFQAGNQKYVEFFQETAKKLEKENPIIIDLFPNHIVGRF